MLETLNKIWPKFREKVFGKLAFDINPLYITLFSLVPAVLAGFFFYQSQWLLGSLMVALNGFCDIMDGQIARKYGRVSAIGDFLDHAFDRFADLAFFLGLTLNPLISDALGIATVIVVLLVSYLGTQAQAVTNVRLYAAILGRADRMVLLIVGGILAVFLPGIFNYILWVILIFSGLTIPQRLFLTLRVLHKEKKKLE